MRFDPSEITNPRRTQARREIEAGLDDPTIPAESPTSETHSMSQADFFKKGPRINEKDKQRRLIQKLREHDN